MTAARAGLAATVDTRDGPVRGRVETDPAGRTVRVFRGVPYAAPPVGAGRFAPPAPVAPWREPFDAATFGPSAPQPVHGPLAGLVPGMAVGPTSEDCLTLNVWTPDASPATPRPVMVWLHGGAFTIGGSSLPTYDAARLAAEGDVVVVSCNYRLGALGFASVDAPNCGLLDQLAVLEWVGANAVAFGGDPANVTVFGESAGAGCILHLLASPAARGRFRRAVVQSGATNLTLQPDAAAVVAETFADRLGVPPDDLDGLRAAPVADVLAAQDATAAATFATVGMTPFHPVADGVVVASTPLVAVEAGAADGVDLLIGTTRDEMRLFLGGVDAALDRDRLLHRLERLVGADHAPALLAAYEGSAGADRARPGAVWADAMPDAEMTLPAIAIADAHTARGNATYAYRFDWPAAPGPVELGACHGIDLPFTFGTLDREGWDRFVADAPAAHALSVRVRAAWCAFARDGDPGWPCYERSRRTTMLLGRDARPVDDPFGERLRAWPVS